MTRRDLGMVFCLSLGLFFSHVNISSATIIRGAILHGVVINVTPNPCAGLSIGQACTGGALYAGQYNGYHYMTTPGNCTDYANNSTAFSPTCNGATDTVEHAWANNSGTSANNVVTGASSTTYGESNATILLNYTDTDAARYCHYMNYGGYTDWYLPAASLASDTNGELYNVLYVNRAALGGLQSAPRYYSSTESTAANARVVVFGSGTQTNFAKTVPTYVRCVRRY